MGKRIAAIVIGAVTAVGVIFLVEFLSSSIYPLPSGIDLNNRASIAAIMDAMPVGAYLLLLAGYAAGCFAGGGVASLISGRENPRTSIIVGCIVLLGGIMNMIELPHPLWFSIISMLVYIPFSYFGHVIVQRKKSVAQ